VFLNIYLATTRSLFANTLEKITISANCSIFNLTTTHNSLNKILQKKNYRNPSRITEVLLFLVVVVEPPERVPANSPKNNSPKNLERKKNSDLRKKK
jgi:hypothetical protein